jgi:MFS family permease
VDLRHFDVAGAVLLALAVTGVSVVLSEGGSWGWTSATTVGTAVACVAAALSWGRWELGRLHPLVDLHLLRHRPVLMADVAGFLISTSMYLVVPIIVEFIQVPTSAGFGFGASVVVSGLVLVPLSVGTFLASRLLVPLERWVGVRAMIPVGSLVFASASTFFALVHTSLWQAFVAMGIVGLGIGSTFAAMPGFIVRAVPRHETGSATGFYQVLRNIGLSVGSALGAAVLLGATPHGHQLPRLEGFRTVLLLSAGLGVLTAVLSFVLPGRTPSVAAHRTSGPADADEVHMQEEALLDGAGVMLADGRDLDGPVASGPA